MEMIKEALNEGYCDISGTALNLALVGAYPRYVSKTYGLFNPN
jgi:hypothetical protein